LDWLGVQVDVYGAFRRHVTQETSLRTLFRTEDGCLGNGPASQAVGDLVFIPAGAHTLFVLFSVGHGRYEVIGHAYFHGLMHGEAEHLKLAVQEITLV
jgi:hypothetical protein